MSFLPRLAQVHTEEILATIADTNAIDQFLRVIRAFQAQARYPALLTGLRGREDVAYQERCGSGLITVAIEQKLLGDEELKALGAFRLQQYLLCGWYDPQKVLADQAETDPELERMPANALHILTGTADGQILAYCMLQGATTQTKGEDAILTNPNALYLQDAQRPLFASEREFFGTSVFASLPALHQIPIGAMGDLTCLLRNQALSTSVLSTVAVVDATSTMIQFMTRIDSGLQAILGSIDREARHLLAAMSVPILYAPLAPVVVSSLPYKHYWAAGEVGTSVQGKYWPFVAAIEDLRAHAKHFARLDQTLSESRNTIRRALVAFRKEPRIAPAAFVPEPGASAFLWTDDPDYH